MLEAENCSKVVSGSEQPALAHKNSKRGIDSGVKAAAIPSAFVKNSQ